MMMGGDDDVDDDGGDDDHMKGIQVTAMKTSFQATRGVILAMEKIRRGTFMRRQSTIGNWKGTVQQEQPHTTEYAWLTLIYPGID